MRTSAHLSYALDDRYYNLENRHGENGARLAAQSHKKAIDTIEEIVAAHTIECDFKRVDGFLFFEADQDEDAYKEIEAAKRAGVAVEEYHRKEEDITFPAIESGKTLRFPNQAQFTV